MTLVVSTDLPFSSITIPNTPRKAHLLYNNLKPENLPPDFEEPWRHRDSINLAATTIISLLDDDFAKLPAVKEVIHLHWRVICKWAAAIVTYCVWIDEHSPENKMVSHFMALEYTFVFTVKDLVVLMNEELVDGMAKIWTSALDPNFRRSLLEFPQLESVYLSCLETVMSPGHAMAQTIPHVRLREAVRLDPSTYKNAGVANLRSAVQAATAKWDQGDSSLRTPQMFTCLFTLGLMHSFFCNPEISPVAWTPAQNFQVSADVIKLLAKVLDQPVKSNLATLEKMQPYVETCLNGLIMVSTVSEGRAWLVQAIRLDLLLLIAKLLLWLDNAAMLDVENHVEIITLLRTYIESLIPYLIFAPVIRAIPSRVAQFGEQPTTGSNHLVLCRLQWTIVQSMSAEDLRLLQGVELRCTNANVSAFKFATPSSRSFNLSQCANAPSRAALKQCNGCRRAYYCSLGCQKFDWKHGDHRRECSHIQRKRISSDVDWLPLAGREYIYMLHTVTNMLSHMDQQLSSELASFWHEHAPIIRVTFQIPQDTQQFWIARVITRNDMGTDEITCFGKLRTQKDEIAVLLHLPVGPNIVYYEGFRVRRAVGWDWKGRLNMQ